MAHPSKYHRHKAVPSHCAVKHNLQPYEYHFHKAVPSHCAVKHTLQLYEPNSIHHSTRCVCSHYCLNKPPAGAASVGPAPPAAFCCCWAAVPSCGCMPGAAGAPPEAIARGRPGGRIQQHSPGLQQSCTTAATTTQSAACAATTASTSLPLVLPGWVLHPPPPSAAAGQLFQAVAACLVRRVRHQKPLRVVGLAGESNSTAPDSNKAAPQQRPPPKALLVQPLLPQQASRWCCLGGSCTPRRLLLLLGSCSKLWLHAWCGGCATRSCCTW